ncbi:hypothetical protein BGX31_010902 [Mortierella sp. GBA43]|nr:hypothetical protein BGX31_010902 [Mortierella sp. GBA43]
MRLSRASLLALCAATLLVVLPDSNAEVLPIFGGKDTTTKDVTHASTATHASSTTTTAVATKDPTTPATQTTAPATTTAARTPSPATKTATPTQVTKPPIIVPPPPAGSTNTTLPPGGSTACVNSSTCPQNYLCALGSTGATAGTCVPTPGKVCALMPIQTCTTSSDCPIAFSLCIADEGQMICAGLGNPGTDTECKQDTNGNQSGNSSSSDGSGGLVKTATYAGIAVGSVAALAVLFALVRWQRRRQRSQRPDDMFPELDYGGGSSKVESYPFSNRANAHGSDVAPLPPHATNYNNNNNSNNSNNNQYYEEPVGYSGSGGHQQDQYYNGQYYKEGGYGNGGYDSRHGDGYYDNGGYQQGGGHPMSPPAAARSPRQNYDNYGPEGSEQDFGHGSAHGGQGYGGGYGRQY